MNVWPKITLAFLAGILLTVFVATTLSFEYDKRLSLVQILQLFFTLFLALIIQTVLQRKTSARENEKRLLIEYLKEVRTTLTDCRKLFISCYQRGSISEEDDRAILALLSNVSNALSTAETNFRNCAIDLQGLRTSRNHYERYKEILTGGGYPNSPYTGDHFSEQERRYRMFYDSLVTLDFEINRQP